MPRGSPRPPAPSWHPGAHPAPQPGRLSGLSPSQGPWHHLPGAERITSAALSPALPRTRPARQTPHLPLQSGVGAPEAAKATAARPLASHRTVQGPSHPASPSAQGWIETAGPGSTGNWEKSASLVPADSLQLCTGAGTRLHHCTFAWLQLCGGDVQLLQALGAGRRRWEDLGSPPARTYPALSVRGAEADAGPSLGGTNQSGQGTG